VSLPAVLRRAISVLEGDRRYRDLVGELRGEVEKLESRRTVRRSLCERRPAVEGEKFVWREAGVGGSHEIELEVRPKSPGDEGLWLCLSCGVSLEHNLDKDLHCQGGGKRGFPRRQMRLELGDHRARHVLGWRNFSSGFVEVP